MKNLTVFKLTAGLVLLTSIMNSQDTIYLKSNEKIEVKITEIDINTVSYKAFQNIDSPEYIINKMDIIFIKFSNGTTDTIQSINNISNEIITKKEKVLKNKSRIKFIDTCSINYKEEELELAYHQMEKYDKNRKVVAPILLIIGFVPPILVTNNLLKHTFSESNLNSQDTMALFMGGVLVGAVIRISACVFATVNKHKYWNQKKKLAKMSDEMP